MFDARYATIYFMVVVFIYFAATAGERFYEKQNLTNILGQSAVLGVAAVGLTIPLIVGQFDLSTGWHASFAAVLGTNLAVNYGTGPAIIVVLLAGVAIGTANALVVTKLRVSAIIATLAMGALLVGLSQRIAQAATFGLPTTYRWLGQTRWAGVPVSALLMLAVGCLLWLVTTQTPFGRKLHAIGDNEEASRLFGLPIERESGIAFVIAAVCASLSGLMLSSRLAAGTFGAGDGLLLDGFTSAAIGMVTIRRSQFNVIGTIIAVLLLTMMTNGMTISGWPNYWQNIVKAFILVSAVSASSLRKGAAAATIRPI